MAEVANWPALSYRQIQLINHPATKQKTTLKTPLITKKHFEDQRRHLKTKEILRWQDASEVLRLRCEGFYAFAILR